MRVFGVSRWRLGLWLFCLLFLSLISALLLDDALFQPDDPSESAQFGAAWAARLGLLFVLSAVALSAAALGLRRAAAGRDNASRHPGTPWVATDTFPDGANQALQEIRDDYLRLFDAAVEAETRSAEEGQTVAVEVQHERRASLAGSLLGTVHRDDIWVISQNSEPEAGVHRVQVTTSKALTIAPVTFDYSERKTRVRIEPFSWHEAQLSFAAEEIDVEFSGLLTLWAQKWFDLADVTSEGKQLQEPQGVVHSVIGPLRTGTGWALHVDLGSASVEAAWELIDVCAQFVTEVRLGGREAHD